MRKINEANVLKFSPFMIILKYQIITTCKLTSFVPNIKYCV